MLACVDVHYGQDQAVAVCVSFEAWDSESWIHETRYQLPGEPEPYEPGEFYRRELPCVLGVMGTLREVPKIILVDSYVWLGEGKRGMGAHLHDAMGESIAVVGVAKNRFRTAESAVEVLRGNSRRPLFVSAVGIDAEEAAEGVRRMAGKHRIPLMVKRADQLARSHWPRWVTRKQ